MRYSPPGAPLSKLAKLAIAQNWKCCWCQFLMAADPDGAGAILAAEWVNYAGLSKATKRRLHKLITVSFDHIIPKSEGGSNAEENGRASCAWCNSYRGSEPAESFLERITCILQRGEHPRQIFRAEGHWPSRALRKGAIGNGKMVTG